MRTPDSIPIPSPRIAATTRRAIAARAAAALLFLALCPGADRVLAQTVLLSHPDATRVTVRAERIAEPGVDVDLYYPPAAGAAPLPVVLFVLAFPESSFVMKDHPQYQSWARLLAAEGFVAVLYSVREPERDAERVAMYLRAQSQRLGLDAERIALWSCSGNTALALALARSPRLATAAFVAYYGLMPTPDGFQAAAIDSMTAKYAFAAPAHREGEAYPADMPMLVVRAGQDSWPEILASVDHFAAFALEQNLDLTLVNYPDGQHGFDVRDDNAHTRYIIRRTLAFLRQHLSAEPSAGG